jgi:membrane-bound lytic murein transglycosylase D
MYKKPTCMSRKWGTTRGRRGYFHADLCYLKGTSISNSVSTFERDGKMKRFGSILIVCFLLGGYVAPSSAAREAGPITVQAEDAEKTARLLQEMDALRQSLSTLRSEIDLMKREIQRLNDLRASLPEGRNLSLRPALTAWRLPGDVSLCGERIPLQVGSIRENLDREFLQSLNSEAQVLLWMKRARRYFPHIEKMLKNMGLPDDLKYLTITESSLWPYAVSSASAAGIWQFIPSTGEKYGMKKARGVDERFDFFKATEGALAYLKSLYEEFGSWPLAMAAYNAGENRIRKEILLQEVRNYFFLDLPLQTERYVYKIAVAKILLSDPKQFGFRLDEKELYEPLQVDRVQIELTQPLPIIEIARALGIFYKDVKELNLHFSEENIPAGIHFVNLPPGTAERFRGFFSAWKNGWEKR